MERAGNGDTDPDAERRGLGTPATRAAVLEKLVKGGFAERQGKQLIPTPVSYTHLLARQRADAKSASYSRPSLREAKPALSAPSSIEEIHKRRMGFLQPAAS